MGAASIDLETTPPHTHYRRPDPNSIHDDDPPQSTTTPNSLLHRRCSCFPCFRRSFSSSSSIRLWDRLRSPSQAHTALDHASTRPTWWTKGVHALMKIREWSEIVAGPKWKTFIRRFNRNRGGGAGGNRNGGKFQFQYDPLSYALNFDEGPIHGDDNGDYFDTDDGYGNFSSRYASVNANRDVTVTT